MTIENNNTMNEAQIREIIEKRIEAIREKDANALAAGYAPDVVMFSLAPPLQYKGANKKATEDWFNSYETQIDCEFQNLVIETGDEIGFCYYFYRIGGTLKSGNKVNMWVRISLGFRKIDEKWKIIHEHQSVPFDMQTFQAQLDLKP